MEDQISSDHYKSNRHNFDSMSLTVASLNFSGVNTSPFQYDDGSDFFQQVNYFVKEIIKKEHPALKDWEVGKIDKEFTSSSRQSVCFNSKLQTVRMKFFERLPNKEEFFKIWREKFGDWSMNNKISKKPTGQEIQTCISMDYVFYRALLQYVYKVETVQELQKNIKHFVPQKLQDFLEKQFHKPSTQVNMKRQSVVNYILTTKPDVLCLQEANCVDWKSVALPGYASHQNHDSVIIYKRQRLGEINYQLMQQLGQHLDFNEDSSFLFTDKNYLILSVHLKSKKEVNVKQSKQMFTFLKGIKANPEFKNLKVIIGMDANNFIEKEILSDLNGKNVFSIAPDRKEKPTTVKKRSFMQGQFTKAGLQVSEVKDHVVSSLSITSYKIQKIDGQQSSNELLPNEKHPYDHFIVKAVFQLN